MSGTAVSLRRKIRSASDLHAVVRTMKALAAANIGQYEQSVLALADYYRTLELGLCIGLRSDPLALPQMNLQHADVGIASAVVFGSDQGLVGQFNDAVADFALTKLAALPGKVQIWAVGARVHARLADTGLTLMEPFPVPTSVKAISPLIRQILLTTESAQGQNHVTSLQLFYNCPGEGEIYVPVVQKLLPLDERWHRELAARPWPSENLPEMLGNNSTTLRALIREYLFVSLFRAASESLASENASRLAAMQRADKNIDELLAHLNATFHQMRQNGIDEELFDVISGFEALAKTT